MGHTNGGTRYARASYDLGLGVLDRYDVQG